MGKQPKGFANGKHDLKRGVNFIGVTCVFVCHDGKGRFLLHKRSKNCRDEQGRCLAPGERGEIFVRGDQVSGEYLHKKAIADDGWLVDTQEFLERPKHHISLGEHGYDNDDPNKDEPRTEVEVAPGRSMRDPGLVTKARVAVGGGTW